MSHPIVFNASTDGTIEPVELPSHYAKAIVAIIAAGLGIVLTALSDQVITAAEWVGVGLGIVGAVGVYLIPNLPTGWQRYSKMVLAIVFAVLQALAPLAIDGRISTTGLILIALAALNAVGVGIIPNTSPVQVTTSATAGGGSSSSRAV